MHDMGMDMDGLCQDRMVQSNLTRRIQATQDDAVSAARRRLREQVLDIVFIIIIYLVHVPVVTDTDTTLSVVTFFSFCSRVIFTCIFHKNNNL